MKRWYVLISISFILTCILFLYSKENSRLSTGDKELDTIYSKQEIQEDRNQMIKLLEDVHPIFLDDVPEEYYKAKEKYIEETNHKMSLGEFQLATSRYTSSIDDGHTGIGWIGAKFLDVNWKFIDGNLVILDKDNKPTSKIVTSIGDIEIENILKEIDKTFSKENYVDEYMLYSNLSKERLILNSMGVDTTQMIMLGIKENDKIYKMEVKFEETQILEGSDDFEIFAKNIDEDIIYVKLGICDINNDLKEVIKYIESNLKTTKYIIIDVRDNPGGNSYANEIIFQSLKIKPGYFGGTERYSKEVSSFIKSKPQTGSDSFERSNDVVKNENIELYVLMNENSFSSAQWLATIVSDGELGTLVGKPSRNTPSSYGNAIPFKLDNTNIQGQMSFTKWLRPDENKDDVKVLEPHIKIEDGEDALEKTLEIIKGEGE